RIAAGRSAMNAPGDIGVDIDGIVELPVRRSDQLAVWIDLEFEAAAGFFFDLLGPLHHPFMKSVLRRNEMRELERNGFLSPCRRPCQRNPGDQGASLDGFQQ